MKRSILGLLVGSTLVIGLSGCASSATQSAGGGTEDNPGFDPHPFVCALAGGLIGGGIGYVANDQGDNPNEITLGATIGTTAGAIVCADRSPAPTKPQCPSGEIAPASAAVDEEGCPLDSDNDGVSDYRDQCPRTAAGVEVNASGCPLDSDKDGVTDDSDQCANTPAGVEVNSLGCPASLVLDDVNFEFDSATLTAKARNQLNAVAARLVKNAGVRVNIKGYTDSRGSSDYNQRLSQRRAEAVAEHLTRRGVSADRMRAVGFGEASPIATNDTQAGRLQNRRVELDEWK